MTFDSKDERVTARASVDGPAGLEEATLFVNPGEPSPVIEDERSQRVAARADVDEELGPVGLEGTLPSPTIEFIPGAVGEVLGDRVRRDSFRMWTADGPGVRYMFDTVAPIFLPYQLTYGPKTAKEERTFGKVYKQQITFIPNTGYSALQTDGVFSFDKWKKYIRTVIKEDICYEDNTFKVQLPLSEEDRKIFEAANVRYYDINSVYNFFEVSEADELLRRRERTITQEEVDILLEEASVTARYNRIEFSADTNNPLVAAIDETNLFGDLYDYSKRESAKEAYYTFEQILRKRETFDGQQVYSDSEWVGGFTLKNSATLDKWVQREAGRSFTDIIQTLVFLGRIKKITDQKIRSPQDIFDGMPAYSETAFYRIDKKLTTSGELIQSFVFNNTEEVVRWFDLEVKYEESYTYEVFVLELVLGTRYKYTNVEILNQFARSTVVYEPVLKIVETPYFIVDTRITDLPPIQPDVNIVPYKGDPNRILILLNSGIGFQELDPVEILSSDRAHIDMHRVNQRRPTGKLQYRSDDPIGKFQVMRLDERPISYQDFKTSKITTISTTVGRLKSSAGSFRDVIESNTKYWYTFRSVDIHDHVSNPTAVFQVEIVQDGGTTYLLLDVIEFDIDKGSTSRSFKKYLMIQPAFPQRILNSDKSELDTYETAADVQDVFLGVADETVWDKKYKIRFTSTKTNKKVDLNVIMKSVFVREE